MFDKFQKMNFYNSMNNLCTQFLQLAKPATKYYSEHNLAVSKSCQFLPFNVYKEN
jgi:hypothetical protein